MSKCALLINRIIVILVSSKFHMLVFVLGLSLLWSYLPCFCCHRCVVDWFHLVSFQYFMLELESWFMHRSNLLLVVPIFVNLPWDSWYVSRLVFVLLCPWVMVFIANELLYSHTLFLYGFVALWFWEMIFRKLSLVFVWFDYLYMPSTVVK